MIAAIAPLDALQFHNCDRTFISQLRSRCSLHDACTTAIALDLRKIGSHQSKAARFPYLEDLRPQPEYTMKEFLYITTLPMDFLEKIIDLSSILISLAGVTALITINREKLQKARLNVEIISDTFKVNLRNNNLLDFQINLRIKAISKKVCLREVTLIRKRGKYFAQDLEVLSTFDDVTNIGGDLTKYDEKEFIQFIGCTTMKCDCSRIVEPESRLKEFIKLKDLILEEDKPRPVTLLGRILDYSKQDKFCIYFSYDLKGKTKNLSKRLDFERYIRNNITSIP